MLHIFIFFSIAALPVCHLLLSAADLGDVVRAHAPHHVPKSGFSL
jgi:hypothetical protein